MPLHRPLLSLAITASLAAAQTSKITTGPEVGATLPAFEAQDQTGAARNLASLTGPKGLMLVFFRSADW